MSPNLRADASEEMEIQLSQENSSRTPSPLVSSRQTGSHPDLLKTLRRHRVRAFSKPIAAHTRESFDWVRALVASDPRPLILDSGCGVGEATGNLAARFPDRWVIGVEKSASRLRKGGWTEPGRCAANRILVRAELADFWRLAVAAGWRLERHYLLYPSPWPKAGQLMRRWHAHPVFETMLELGGLLELRTNWRIYAEEFAAALEFFDHRPSEVQYFQPVDAVTPFERKFTASGHRLFRVRVDLGSAEC